VATLTASWARRNERDEQNAFRARFMRINSDARDTFARSVRPDGSYPYEHCTVGLERGAQCAAYSPYCIEVIAAGLRSGDTPLAARGQYIMAASKACTTQRAALVATLAACDAIAPDDRCQAGSCTRCVAGRLAALSVLVPLIAAPSASADYQSLIDTTPEPVARAIAEVLGAPDAPADLETVVVQRSLRAYCFSLVARSASPPPFACNAVMVRFLTHPEYGDASRSWEALERASGAVRAQVLSALFVEVVRHPSIPEATLASLRTLPSEGTTRAIAQAMLSPTTSQGVWSTLRSELVRRGVTGAALPPVNRPSTPPPSAPSAVPSPSPAAPARTTGQIAPFRAPS
jgi:hypothetical protein